MKSQVLAVLVVVLVGCGGLPAVDCDTESQREQLDKVRTAAEVRCHASDFWPECLDTLAPLQGDGCAGRRARERIGAVRALATRADCSTAEHLTTCLDKIATLARVEARR